MSNNNANTIEDENVENMNELILKYSLYITNSNNIPREYKIFKKDVKRNTKDIDRDLLLSIIQNNKNPYFILNKFSGGDIKYL